MAHWLLKTEPGEYSYDDLERDKQTTWDGVSNALALKHIRAIRKGDRVLIYHTGSQKRLAVVDLKPLQRLPNPVTLAQMKADKAFEGWELLRIGRLSVMPVPANILKRIEQLAKEGA